jgi:hypothetical protein
VIRVDALWLAVQPLDMRAGTEAALAAWSRCSAQPDLIMRTCSPTDRPTE